MAEPSEGVIRELLRMLDITAEEARSLTAGQADDILGIIRDSRSGLLTEEEAIWRMEETGVYELPSKQETLRLYLEEVKRADIRALADLHNAECLRRGEPEKMVRFAKEEGRGYPPPRSN